MKNPFSRQRTRQSLSPRSRTMRRAVAVLAVALLAVFAGLAVWLSREQTLVAAAATLVERSHGQLALDGVSGTLLRPIHVDRAMLRSGRYEFVLENTTLRWRPLWLLVGVVAFDPVSVERAKIASGAGSNEPAQPPRSLAAPIKLRLERASIDHLVFIRGDTAREIGPLTLGVHAGAKSLAIAIEPAQTPWGRLTANADIENDPPFALKGGLDLQRTGDRPLSAHLDVGGELARIDLKWALRAQTSTLDASAIVQPFAAQMIEQAHARAHAIDPRNFTETAPAALFEGQLDIATEGDVTHGNVEVANQSAGPIDDDRVPLSRIAAGIQAQP